MMTTIATSDSDLAQAAPATTVVSKADLRSSLRPAIAEKTDAAQPDVLVQLRSNLNQLEDLHGRLRYVMTEISYLIRK